ncbi:ethanolamine kinase 2 isoform X1 [Phyllopteryx taeniolatus]|uniref:ethanolamine kinase 2 isoform X1 n=1 Tax=Phyllopteryx taeniolatus TaxID=161469 RepID=UPI002AD493E3|nr:ethanolamine kinase 2 isoform X1 [Phyllopteryx taeniolatus]
METQIHVPVGSPLIRKIAIFVDEHNVKEGAMKIMKELRPEWDVNYVKTKFFTDGTTNKLVGCYVEDSPEDVVLVRVYGNKTELIVDRDNELKSFQVLHANGCAPRLYCSFQNGICYEYMQGDALGTKDVRDPSLLRLIAGEMARIHAIHAHNGCIPKPNLWIKMQKYFSLVATEFTEQASNIRIQKEVPSKEVLEQEMVWMKEHLSTLGSPVVLCHNDLLCKNIIHNSKEAHVRFIDYEYSSYNYQAFDIGNHFNEFAGDTVNDWLEHQPHSSEDLGSIPDPACVEFACSPRACVGFLRALRFPPTSQKHALIGDSKLPVGMTVSANGCLFLCALRLAGNQFRVYPTSCPMTAGIGSSTPATLVRRSGSENGWMYCSRFKKLLVQLHSWH